MRGLAGRPRRVVALVLLAALLVFATDVAAGVISRKLAMRNRPSHAVEKTYRIASPVYHHDLAPGMSVPAAEWGPRRYPVYTNSLGFKDASPRQVPLASTSRRILFMGDSFTEGIGLPYEQTFVGLLDQSLKARGVEVLNGAVSSYSPAIHFAKVKYLIEKVGLRFDELVVYLDISDPQDEALFYRLEGDDTVVDRPSQPSAAEARNYVKRSALQLFLYRNTILTKTIVFSLHDRRLELNPIDMLGQSVDTVRSAWTFDKAAFDAYGRAGLGGMAENMDRLLRLLGEHHIPLTIAVYPWPAQVLFDPVDSKQAAFWREWAARRGVGFIDHFPDFIDPAARKRNIEAYYLPADTHWNAEGHALVARRFLEQYPVRPAGSGPPSAGAPPGPRAFAPSVGP